MKSRVVRGSPSRPTHHEWTYNTRHAAPRGIVGLERKSAGAHQLPGGAVATAPTGEGAPRAEQVVLPRSKEPRVRSHVFDEQQLAVRAKHACDLAKRALGVVDGA